MSEIGTISTYGRGADLVVEWEIGHFFTFSGKYNAWYYSPQFSFGGERWNLGIFPFGSSQNDSYGHVDLYLLNLSPYCSTKQSFSISLKSVTGEKYNEQQCSKDFENNDCVHRCNRFIRRLELFKRKSKLVPEGVLTVVCTMKSSTSAGSDSNAASASAECLHCKGTFNSDSLSSHQKKCMHRPTKCPDCSEVVVLQKWLNEHECQQERPEGKKQKGNSENASVNATTQTEEDNAQILCEDLKRMLFDGRHHDLILKVGDKELRAHRDILRVRSRVFESMLDHDMKEKNTGIIDVSDCHPNAMELFLSYVYCGKIEALDHSNILGLYYVADKYEMMELKRECYNFIKKSLSLTNICSVIQLAWKHSDSELLEYATGYFAENMLDIMQTVEWQSFLKDNSTVGNELLIKSIKLKNAQS